MAAPLLLLALAVGASAQLPSLDGSGNNLASPLMNAALSPFMPSAGPGANEVTVDLAPLKGVAPTAVRYASGAGSGGWLPGKTTGPDCQRTCCGLGQDCSLKPCPPGSCPLKASGVGALPAVPFHAAIVAGVCKCVPPQVCDS